MRISSTLQNGRTSVYFCSTQTTLGPSCTAPISRTLEDACNSFRAMLWVEDAVEDWLASGQGASAHPCVNQPSPNLDLILGTVQVAEGARLVYLQKT